MRDVDSPDMQLVLRIKYEYIQFRLNYPNTFKNEIYE